MKEIKITCAQLEEQYRTMEVQELAEHYGITYTRLYQLLDQCGIPRKLKRRRMQDIPRITIEG